MAANPLGFVQAYDFGNPRIITGKANEAISGGQLVGVSGVIDVVSSGLNTFAVGDVAFILCDDSENFVGMAIETKASGATIAVAIDSVVIGRCAGSVFAGRLVRAVSGTNAFANVGSTVVPADAEDAASAGNIGGRALTAGVSGGYAVLHIKP